MKSMRKVILMFICFFWLVGCTKNSKPSDEQILADLNRLGYTSTIMYAYTGNDVEAVSDIKETHNLELASFQVEKSNTEDKEYEAWLEVTAKDAEVTETVNAYVKYAGYDKNYWELENYELEYDADTIVYKGEINPTCIEKMFNNPLIIEDISIIESSDRAAKVKITAVNQEGYYNVDQRNTITGTVGFETTVDFYFDPDSKSWYCNDLRSESATITPVDLHILEKFIANESQSIVAEKNTEELDDRRYFSQKIMNPEIGESQFKNSNGNFEQLDCYYSLGVNTIYYTSEVEGITHIQFATGSGAPAFTYELSNELFEEEARDNWKVNCTYPVYYNASGNGKYAGTITIEYPLKSDMNKAMVAVRVDEGTEKEITLQGTYMAEVSDKDLEVRIRDIEFPIWGVGEWRSMSEDIFIEPNGIHFGFSFALNGKVEEDQDLKKQAIQDKVTSATTSYSVNDQFAFEYQANLYYQTGTVELIYPYNGDVFHAYVKITHDADTEGKHVWAETRRVQEIEEGVLKISVNFPQLDVKYKDGGTMYGGSAGSIYIDSQDVYFKVGVGGSDKSRTLLNKISK